MFALKLAYVDAGESEKALELEECMAGIVGKNGGGALGSSGGGAGKKSELLVTTGVALDTFLNERMRLLELELAGGGSSSTSRRSNAMHERAIRRQILKEFQGACSKCLKCQNCGAFSPKIRHDQFNKMFQVGMPRRNVKVS